MQIRKKMIIFLSVVVLLIAAIIYFIILPTVADIKKINHAVYLERIDLEVKYQRGQLLNKALDDFERIKNEENKFRSVFINAGQELEFVTSLEQIAEKYNIIQDLQLEKLDPSEKINNYNPIRLTINTIGEFDKILSYLKELNTLNYYYNINAITVTPSKENNDDIDLKMDGNIFIVNSNEINNDL